MPHIILNLCSSYTHVKKIGFGFWDKVFLCSFGCPGTHSVDQAGIELKTQRSTWLCLSSAGIKAYISTVYLRSEFKYSVVHEISLPPITDWLVRILHLSYGEKLACWAVRCYYFPGCKTSFTVLDFFFPRGQCQWVKTVTKWSWRPRAQNPHTDSQMFSYCFHRPAMARACPCST